MPEVEYTTRMRLPVSAVWAFVSDMNNWAPFLTGYQKHEIVDETDSIWTLKGDVGILSRIVELRAHVTEWVAPERVTFTLIGLNEAVEGGGTLLIGRATTQATPAPAPRVGWLRRLFGWLARLLFRLVNRSSIERPALKEGPSAEGSELKFTLRMDAGGPTGPLVNAMLAPAMEPAVEDLANKIAAHLEGTPTGDPAATRPRRT
jgi:carbon monoxide dehydrogenase subunit G